MRAMEMASASPRDTAAAHHGMMLECPGEEGKEKGTSSMQGRALSHF